MFFSRFDRVQAAPLSFLPFVCVFPRKVPTTLCLPAAKRSAPSSRHLPPHPCFPAHLSVQMLLKAVTTVRSVGEEAARPSAASTRAHQTDMSPDKVSLGRTLNPKQLWGRAALQRYERPPTLLQGELSKLVLFDLTVLQPGSQGSVLNGKKL